MTQHCFLCTSPTSIPLHEKNGYEIVRCSRCGLVRVDPLPSPEELSTYYREEYDQFKYSFANPLAEGRQRKSAELKIVERFAHRGPLIDVGAGHGQFLINAQRHGWAVSGVEPQNEARVVLQSRLRTPIYESLDLVPLQGYAVATMWHVVEHLADPMEFLRQVRDRLVENGILVVATPNIDSIAAKVTGKSWGWLSPPDHLFLYSPMTLPRLVMAAGFEPIHVLTRRGESRNILILLLQGLAYRLGLFQRMKRSVQRAAYRVQSRRSLGSKLNTFYLTEKITDLLSLLLYPFLVILWKMGLGDEVLVVARKRSVS